MTVDYFAKFVRLSDAVRTLYYSAYWYPDREVDATKLWDDVRDAAGFEKGFTHKFLGDPKGPRQLSGK